LESKTPVAITRHGATIGIYLPIKPKPSHSALEAFRAAGEKMQEQIAAAGTNEEELMADFKRLAHSANWCEVSSSRPMRQCRRWRASASPAAMRTIGRFWQRRSPYVARFGPKTPTSSWCGVATWTTDRVELHLGKAMS
jgi:hypothetical protein